MDRRSEAVGGWGALAVGLLALVGAGCEVALLMAARQPGAPSRVQEPAVALALVTLGQGLGVLAATRGVRFALRPAPGATGKVVGVASGLGWAGAAALVLEALLGGYGVFAPHPPFAQTLWTIGVAAAALTSVWAVTVCAAAWKLHRLPAWVRVAGVAFGVLTVVNIILPMLRALTLLSALVWWFGLGEALLSLARTPQPGLPAATE